MLIAMIVSLTLLEPDWWQMFLGAVLPQPLEYPDWLASDTQLRAIAAKPVWVEASVYVGVIGGASYDYLAYTSFLRNKRWGLAGSSIADDPDAETLASAKNWLRAPMVDCAMSFAVVVVFSAVFVASGAIVLGPQHQIPGDGNFLEHQSQFVTKLHPWLYPLYVVGTLLTLLGTLYGTLEVAPPMLAESYRLFRDDSTDPIVAKRLRRFAILWSGTGALFVLAVSFVYQLQSGQDRPPGLTNLLTPASLFTGVLSCGFICILNPWMDRVLPRSFQAPVFLKLLNVLAGIVFLAVGIKAYWELGGRNALGILVSTIAVGCAVAMIVKPNQRAS